MKNILASKTRSGKHCKNDCGDKVIFLATIAKFAAFEQKNNASNYS